jgi:hypothetical protein
MCFESELIVGFGYLLVVAAKATVYKLSGMLRWIIMLTKQLDGLLEVISSVAWKEICFFFAL